MTTQQPEGTLALGVISPLWHYTALAQVFSESVTRLGLRYATDGLEAAPFVSIQNTPYCPSFEVDHLWSLVAFGGHSVVLTRSILS